MLRNGQKTLPRFWTPQNHLRRDPCHAPLEDRELSLTRPRLPVAREHGIEPSMVVVNRAREPDIDHIFTQHSLSFSGELLVVLTGRSDVGIFRRRRGWLSAGSARQ